MICYHATPVKIKKFNLNFLEGREHNFGPGIYFSTKKDNISYYLDENKEGYIYKVKIVGEIIIWHEIIKNQKIFKFIKNNFEENKAKELIKKYKGKNYLYLMDNLPYEIYKIKPQKEVEKNYLKDFLIKFTNETNISAMFMQNGTYRDEIISFNPENIKMIKTYKIKNKEEKKKKVLIKKK